MNYGPKGSPMTSKYRSRRLSNSTWHYVSVVVLSDGKIHTTVNSQQHTSTIVSYTIIKKILYTIITFISESVMGCQIYAYTTELFGESNNNIKYYSWNVVKKRTVERL